MNRWQWRGWIDAAWLVTFTLTLTLAPKVAWGCPAACQCTQTYYVYCQGAGLTSDELPQLVNDVPKEALLLDLSDNLVDRLASGAFSSLPNLEYLSLADNRIAALELGAFRSLQRLKELSLRRNSLADVAGGVFVDLPGLKKLHLDGNDIASLGERTFALTNLHQLHLQENKLSLVASLQLTGLPALEYLDLSDNAIHTIEDGAFRALAGLLELRLSRNRLASLAHDAFQGLTSLRELRLEGNLLPSLDCLEDPAFSGTLQRLVLSNNSLVSVPRGVFSRLMALRTLALDHNAIASLGDEAFKGVVMDNLTLAHNCLEVLTREMLAGAKRISLVDLSHNRLHTVKTGAFDSFRESVYGLSLAANRLSSIDHGTFRGMKNVQSLDLSSNALAAIGDDSFRDLTRLVELNLDGNMLWSLSASDLEGPALRLLTVLENPLTELSGFVFDGVDYPVTILVNMTLSSSSPTSLTVTWPLRHGGHLYWKSQLRRLCPSGQTTACDGSLLESTFPPNKASFTFADLDPGQAYFVCVNPVFLARSVHVGQCAVLATRTGEAATPRTPSPERQTSNAGRPGTAGRDVVWLCMLAVVVLVYSHRGFGS